ncbi:MAG: GntR family transcriptional regulator [Actinobacteria bacterium]|nr:GntR family transcriptional regulator [Actinomycetota bacterium]MCL5447375.1 GntR family transcriptional regulator [Actinomycetota bacterium]
MMSLDRASPIPLWAQLAEILRSRLGQGEFSDRFPTEEELVNQYSVSRHTVRESIRRLQEQGLLQRRQGKGTFVVHPRFEQPLQGFYSLAFMLADQGIVEHSDVRALEVRPCGAAGRALDISQGDGCVYIERLRYAGDEPIALDRSWLPEEVAFVLLHADLTAGSLYDHLAIECGIVIDGGTEKIWPVNPDRQDTSLLQLPEGEAAFFVERIARCDSRAVELRNSTVRGDRYQFVVEWPSIPLPRAQVAT